MSSRPNERFVDLLYSEEFLLEYPLTPAVVAEQSAHGQIRPIIFIGHSIGGLVITQVRIHGPIPS